MASALATNFLGFILVLGVLIFVHEAGHFFMAKLFGVRVFVFSFGFGTRLFGFRRGDTDYRVSLIPLGGYVRMSGETPDTSEPNDPADFLAKPKWQRFLILFAGPAMNAIIAVAFIAALNMVGTESLLIRPVIGEVSPGRAAAKAGLQVGDRIVSVNNERINDFDDLRLAITMHAGTPLRVAYERNGRTMTTTLTPEREESEYGPVGRAGIRPFFDPLVGRVTPGSPAAKGGLRSGDRIVAVSGKPVRQLTEVETAFTTAKDKPVDVRVARGGGEASVVLPPSADARDPLRGFLPPTVERKMSLIPAIRDSVQQNAKMVRYIFIALGRLVRTEGSVKELSGPISIARISGDMLRRGWMEVVGLMAMISINLGIMNLLPVPMLDGGHIMILLIEGAARRDLSLRVKERIQQVGFALLATLMIVVLYNDVISNVLRLRQG